MAQLYLDAHSAHRNKCTTVMSVDVGQIQTSVRLLKAEDANRTLNELVNRFMLRRPPSLMEQYLPPKTTQVNPVRP